MVILLLFCSMVSWLCALVAWCLGREANGLAAWAVPILCALAATGGVELKGDQVLRRRWTGTEGRGIREEGGREARGRGDMGLESLAGAPHPCPCSPAQTEATARARPSNEGATLRR